MPTLRLCGLVMSNTEVRYCLLGNCCLYLASSINSLRISRRVVWRASILLSKVVYSFVALVDSLRCSWTLPRFNSPLEMPVHQHDGQRENSHWARMRPCRVAHREEALRRGAEIWEGCARRRNDISGPARRDPARRRLITLRPVLSVESGCSDLEGA